MSGWRAALVALVVGGAILATGFWVTRPDAAADTLPGPTTRPPVEGVRLVCVEALQPVCAAAAAELGASHTTWEVGEEVPELAVVVAPAADLGAADAPMVGRSPIVIGAWRERAQVLQATCGALDAACLSRAIGSTWADLGGRDTWGDFKLGLADPSKSEPGMLAWSVAAGLAEEEALDRSLRLVAPSDGRLLADLVLFGDSRADVVIAPEVTVAGQFENAIGRGGRLEVFYLASGPWVEYAAVAEGRGAGDLLERLQSPELAAVLAGAGLRPPTGEPASMPEGLGAPGEAAPAPDSATRATLLDTWDHIG